MMKTFIAAILFVAQYCYAQQFVNPPVFGTFGNDGINFQAAAFRNNATPKFHFGWNWGSQGGIVDDALGINTYHTHRWLNYGSQNRPADADLILLIDQFGDWGYAGFGPFNTQSMWYHPEITVDSTNSFVPITNDIQGAVFGWYNKVGTRGTGVDSLRWSLTTTNINWHQPVLWNMWKGTGYAWQHWNVNYRMINNVWTADTLRGGLNDPQSLLRDTALYQPRNGKKWYVTLSIKATNTAQFNALADTSRILSITIPYTLFHRFVNTTTTDSIRFDSIPNTVPNALYGITTSRNANDVRGIARRNIQVVGKPRELIITKRMLDGQEPNQGITLSGFFIVDGRLDNFGDYIDNPMLQPESNWTGDTTTVPDEYITNLGLNVYYYPNADVAIDYIRLETQQARRVYFGNQDVELRTTAQAIINDVTAAQTPPARQPKIFRFYQIEERRDQWWGMMRYYNALLDWRATAEVGSLHNQPIHYLHATGMNEFWQGDIFKTSISTRFPAIRKADLTTLPTMGYYEGYEGNVNENYTQHDVESSRYEMQLPNYAPSWTALTFADFANNNPSWYTTNTVITERCLQFNLEKLLYNSYYKQSGLLYHSKPWWSNIWLSGQYWYRVNPNPNQISSIALGYAGTIRPCTGEEARLELTLPLLLGSKGFIYWHNAPSRSMVTDSYIQGLYSSEEEGWLDTLRTTFNNNQQNAVMSVQTAGDWLNRTDNRFYPWQQWFNGTQHNWNLMGHDSDHVYLGDRTARFEVYRMNNFIRANEQELLALKLQAWYGKGYISMYTQTPTHTPANDTLLHRFISTGQIKSRPIGRVHINTTPYYENEVSGRDSTFVDFVLHQRDTFSLDSVFYLGVQNRRTDPLWHDPSYANNNMIFVPTVEWETLLQNGTHDYWRAIGDFRTAQWWQEKYWKRNGCREIIIPFRYVPNDAEPRYLHVQEVGGGIDTIVKTSSNLAVLFVPGEGKLFRVTVQRARAVAGFGNLLNDNQRKIVAFPVTRYENNRLVFGDSIRYHLVYFTNANPNQYVVKYRRSVVYAKSETILNGIAWETENDLSTMPIQMLNNRIQFYQYCGVPSLTIRIDSTVNTASGDGVGKVYVVYGCGDLDTLGKFRIIENVLNSETGSSYGLPHEIDSSYGRWGPIIYAPQVHMTTFLSEWAAPTINASATGNYYAWSDSSRGIKVRWKGPDVILFDTSGSVDYFVKYSTLDGTKCQHPNLNTHSRISLGERECALVWEEHDNVVGYVNYINYTMIGKNNVIPRNVRHYLVPNMTNDPDFRCKTNTDSSIAVMNSDTIYGSHEWPMVSRSLETYQPASLNGRPIVTIGCDRIVWRGQGFGPTNISTRGIDYSLPFNGNPSYLGVWYERRITSQGQHLLSPQISQSSVNQGQLWNESDSALLINFYRMEEPNSGMDGTIWQVNCGYWSFLPLNPTLQMSYPSNLTMINTGVHPRLSTQYQLSAISQYNLHRRVYYHTQSWNDFTSSTEAFFKSSITDKSKPLHWIGYKLPGNRQRILVSNFDIDKTPVLTKPQLRRNWSNTGVLSDTLYSDWFKVSNVSDLHMYAKGISHPCLRIELENKDNRRIRVNIPVSVQNDSMKLKNTLRLIRGGNEEYRLLVLNRCKGVSSYTEELEIDGLTESDQLGKGSNEDEVVTLDLGRQLDFDNTLNVKPNPA
ncbi:MAG: hypothetical protein JNJ85_02960, partial [Candidatus Kapabacteria bacterium]|nr:hypothetical protein [Candidatus Kapabacteria bacterium]